MPDYVSILRRSISGLADASPEMREAVYQRARAALARQLTAVDPPLSTREIELQHLELEDAVARLEAEFAPTAPAPAPAYSGKEDFLYSPPPKPAAAERRHPAPEPADFGAVPTGAGYDEDEEDFEDEDERGSRLPLLIGVLAVVLVVIGAGALCLRRSAIRLFGAGTDEVASADDGCDGRAGPGRRRGTSGTGIDRAGEARRPADQRTGDASGGCSAAQSDTNVVPPPAPPAAGAVASPERAAA